MTDTPLRVALLGCSRGPGEKHLEMWEQVNGANVVLLAERDRKLAETLAGEHGIDQVCHDFQDASVCPDIDIVDIALPPRLHAEAALLGLEAKHHVLCEKPMTPNLEEADRMVAAAAQSDRLFAVHFQLRFYTVFRKMIQLVHEGAIGRPVQWRHVTADGSKDRAPDIGYEGIIQDCGIHLIDLGTLVFGKLVRIQTIGMKLSHRPNLGDYDTATAVVTYEHGDQMALHMCNGLLRGIKGVETDEILGPEGIIQCQPLAGGVWSDNTKITWTDKHFRTHTVAVEDWENWNVYRKYLGQYFVDCINDPCKDRSPLCSAQEGRLMVQVNQAANQSMQTGVAVDIVESLVAV